MNDKDRALQAITLIGEGIKKTRDQIITALQTISNSKEEE